MMKVVSIGWLGVKTPHAGAMGAFCRDVLQLEEIHASPGDWRFRTGDGAEVHVYGPEEHDHDYFGSGPVVGLRVNDFAEARSRLVDAGIEFLYPEPQQKDDLAWQHFRGPDGNIYEIIGPIGAGSPK
jgi:hypothetical protein